MSSRRNALAVAALALGLGAAALWFGRGGAPGAVGPDEVLTADEAGAPGPGALPETVTVPTAPTVANLPPPRPRRAVIGPSSDTPFEGPARGGWREQRRIRARVLDGVRPASGRRLTFAADDGGSGEVGDGSEIECFVSVDALSPMMGWLWVEGLYPDQRLLAFPIDRSGSVTIERPPPGRGRCRVSLRLEPSDADVRVRVVLERLGTPTADGVGPMIQKFETRERPGPARTIGGLVPGRYRVSGAWGETPIPERTIEIHAEDLTLLSIAAP